MGAELVRDEAIVDKIRHMFESRGRRMTDNNRRQADIPRVQSRSRICQAPPLASIARSATRSFMPCQACLTRCVK